MVGSLLVIGTMMMMLCGCQSGSASTSGGDPTTASGLHFSGPWAAAYASAYRVARSGDDRDALRDSQISDREYAYFQSKIVSCMAGLGVDAHWGADKSLEYTKPSGVTNDQIQQCNRDAGLSIVLLRDAINRNPANLDENEIMTTCLKRNKVVPPGYTASDLSAGKDLSVITRNEAFDKCEADPLHYGQVAR
ncbi:hypothetical protein [Leifsonia sp. 22587]|uniref:hypothetical protein n=1 Tax=Leifsonia sp. 22587 TaxID=3453946 RepID=UPI003F83D67B